jgi:hypothetical protein
MIDRFTKRIKLPLIEARITAAGCSLCDGMYKWAAIFFSNNRTSS